MGPRGLSGVVALLCCLGSPAWAISFGDVRVGTLSAPQSAAVTNSLNVAVKVAFVVLDAGPGGAGNPNDFLLDRSAIPNGTIIPAMSSLPVVVTFKPTKTGPTSAQVAVLFDDPNVPVKYIPLDGKGTEPQAAVAPARVDFGKQPVFVAGKPQQVTFTNRGSDAYLVTAVDLGGAEKDWFRTAGPVALPLTVKPGAVVTVDLVVTPLAGGPGAATISFATDDPMNPRLTVALAATGISGELRATPSAGDFGPVSVRNKKLLLHTLANVGLDVLRFEGLRVVEATPCGCFAVVSGPEPDAMGVWPSLAPGQSVMLAVLFEPQAVGEFNGEVVIDTSAPLSRQLRLPLDGRGQLVEWSVDRTHVAFKPTLAGERSASERITITNRGLAPLRLDPVSFGSGQSVHFLVDKYPQAMVPAGGSTTCAVSYTPRAVGNHGATLVIAPVGEPAINVTLEGTAALPVLEVATGQSPPYLLDLDAAGVRSCVGRETAGLPVTLRVPQGGVAIGIDRINLSGSSDFRVEQAAQADLLPGEQTTFNVYFTPSEAAVTREATAHIFRRSMQDPIAKVTFKGTGSRCDADIPLSESGCALVAGRAPGTAPHALLLLAAAAALLVRRPRRR